MLFPFWLELGTRSKSKYLSELIDFMEMKGKARTVRKAEQALNETFRLACVWLFMNSDLVFLSPRPRASRQTRAMKLSSRCLDLILCRSGTVFASLFM
jgi:hypothetical protein